MILNIKKKDYKFKFGIKFVKTLDDKYSVEANGIQFGIGVETLVPKVLTGDIVGLSELLYYATVTESPRPKVVDIEEYLDNVEDIEAVIDEVVEELKKQNATKLKMKRILADVEKNSDQEKI